MMKADWLAQFGTSIRCASTPSRANSSRCNRPAASSPILPTYLLRSPQRRQATAAVAACPPGSKEEERILVLESKAGERGTRIRVSVALSPTARISVRSAAAGRVSTDPPSLRRALFLRKGMNERLYAIAADLQVLVSGTLREWLRYDNYFDLRFAARASLPATGSRRADTPMPVRESEALILRSFPLGEADRLVSFPSRSQGSTRGGAQVAP